MPYFSNIFQFLPLIFVSFASRYLQHITKNLLILNIFTKINIIKYIFNKRVSMFVQKFSKRLYSPYL